MKLPLTIKPIKYHDNDTGKPIGEEYWILDGDAAEIACMDDKEDARLICAAVNAVEGIETEWLEDNAARLHMIVNELAEKRVEADRLQVQNARLMHALTGIIEIGKRDMSNPKYDAYFEIARTAIAEAEMNVTNPAEAKTALNYLHEQGVLPQESKTWRVRFQDGREYDLIELIEGFAARKHYEPAGPDPTDLARDFNETLQDAEQPTPYDP